MPGSNNGVRPCGTSSSTCFTTSLARNTWPARGSNGDFVNWGLEERESLDWIKVASQSTPWRRQDPVKSTLSPRFISRAATPFSSVIVRMHKRKTAKPRVLVSLTKCTDAEGGLADFGPLRDIVRSFEDADHGTVVHHNLSVGITVLSVNLGHLQDARKIYPDASFVVGRKFQNHRGNSVVAQMICRAVNLNQRCFAAPSFLARASKNSPSATLASYVVEANLSRADGSPDNHLVSLWSPFPANRLSRRPSWKLSSRPLAQAGEQSCLLAVAIG